MKAVLALMLAVPMFAQGAVKWEHSLAAGLKRAKAEKKQVFLDVWAEWCPPCQHLRKNIFPTPEAEKALAGFVPVSLMVQKGAKRADREIIAEATKEAEPFGVRAFPTLLILDAEGKVIRKQEGAFSKPEQFAQWLAQK